MASECPKVTQLTCQAGVRTRCLSPAVLFLNVVLRVLARPPGQAPRGRPRAQATPTQDPGARGPPTHWLSLQELLGPQFPVCSGHRHTFCWALGLMRGGP